MKIKQFNSGGLTHGVDYIPPNEPFFLDCAGGYRSMISASIM